MMLKDLDRKVLALFLLASVPLVSVIGSGYTFFIDQIFGPSTSSFETFFGFGGFTGGEAVLFNLISFFSGLVGASIVQDVLLLVITFGSVFLAYHFLREGERFYSAVFFLFNPFFYIRFLTGQWLVVWGLMVLPLAFYSFKVLLEEKSLENTLFFVFSMTLLSGSAHTLFASFILLGSIMFFHLYEGRDWRDIEVSLKSGLIFLPLNAFWIVPLFSTGSGKVSSIGVEHIYAFAPDGTVFNAMYSVASMHGFWRGGYVYAKDLVPWTQWLFVPILFFSVHGFMKYRDDERIGYVVKGLGLTWIIALFLGVSVSGPFPKLMEWLYLNVPFLRGMRDSQKFVALIVLVYAYLGGLGVKDLKSSVEGYAEKRFGGKTLGDVFGKA